MVPQKNYIKVNSMEHLRKTSLKTLIHTTESHVSTTIIVRRPTEFNWGVIPDDYIRAEDWRSWHRMKMPGCRIGSISTRRCAAPGLPMRDQSDDLSVPALIVMETIYRQSSAYQNNCFVHKSEARNIFHVRRSSCFTIVKTHKYAWLGTTVFCIKIKW